MIRRTVTQNALFRRWRLSADADQIGAFFEQISENLQSPSLEDALQARIEIAVGFLRPTLNPEDVAKIGEMGAVHKLDNEFKQRGSEELTREEIACEVLIHTEQVLRDVRAQTFDIAAIDRAIRAGEKWAQFVVMHAEKSARIGIDHRATQREKARAPRGGVISEIATQFAGRRDAIGDPATARDLWPKLYGELDARRLDPEDDGEDRILFDDSRGERKSIEFASWRVLLSNARRPKSKS